MKRILSILIASLAVIAIAAVPSTAASFTVLGDGVTTALAAGISGDGSTVVYNQGGTGYVYSGGSPTSLGAYSTFGVEKVGSTVYVGGVTNAGALNAQTSYWKSSAGAWTVCGGSSSTFQGMGIGVSSGGQMWIGGYLPNASATRAQVWTSVGDTIRQVATPTGCAVGDLFYGTANDGSLAGQTKDAGAKYNNTPMYAGSTDTIGIALDTVQGIPHSNVSGNKTGAYAISRDGTIIAGDGNLASPYPSRACYWTKGTGFVTNQVPVKVPLLSGQAYSAGKCVSNSGIVAGHTWNAAATRTVYYYDTALGGGGAAKDLKAELTARGIDMSAWGLMYASGISDDGKTITGYMLPSNSLYFGGTAPNIYSTFIAQIPEPSSLVVLAVGLLGLIRRRKS
jgi:hypothetical protein